MDLERNSSTSIHSMNRPEQMSSSDAVHTNDNAFVKLLSVYQKRVDKALLEHLPEDDSNSTQLPAAMRYAVTNGGKRVRPVLAYATGRALGIPLNRIDIPACALEMMHAYSLVHDDLPAMDDDDLRRGKPTCHKAFDEATAILAGDALQALAFTLLALNTDAAISDTAKLNMVKILGEASGAAGMAAGQAIDLESVGRQLTLGELENMHSHKTGALIKASVLLPAMLTDQSNASLLTRLDKYAGPTYPALLGLDGARAHANNMHQEALSAIDGLGPDFDELRMLSNYIVERTF